MRTNNEKVKNIIISLYFIIFVFGILILTLFNVFSDVSKNSTSTLIIIILIIALLFVLTYRVSKFFEYDSDGIKVVFLNKGLLLTEYLNYREHKLELDKDKLIGFKFHNYYFYKTLVIYYLSRHNNKKREVFNVTLVSRKKRRYIKQSIRKIIKHNTQSKQQF
ncbi:MAG: hypothetical protein HKO92_11290 [Flavobacteriaceae bacterium]|nr:hypothetical protein [Flavobacteriaceae bacterium]